MSLNMTCHKKHNVTRPKCQKIWNVATYKMSKNMKCQEIQKNYVTNYKMSKNMICYKTWVVKKYETSHHMKRHKIWGVRVPSRSKGCEKGRERECGGEVRWGGGVR